MAEPNILVVDDSQITLDLVQQGLESAGYRVTTLDNPIEMSSVIRQDRPDLIVLDVKMPLLSGDKVVEILKKYRFSGEIPVLLFSTLEEKELESIARRTESAGFLKKSRDLSGLVSKIEDLLKSGSS